MNKITKLIDIIKPYCDKITHNGKHYKAYLAGTNNIVTIAGTSSDRNFERQVYRDFRKAGVIIKEFNY